MLSVSIQSGTEKACRYIISYEDEEVVHYETSADPRKAAGKIGLRNIIVRQVNGYDKEQVEALLTEGIERNTTELAETLGSS